jgi:hypothetical protein
MAICLRSGGSLARRAAERSLSPRTRPAHGFIMIRTAAVTEIPLRFYSNFLRF